VERADLLVINKIDIAPLVGASVERMVSDAGERREGRPTLPTSLRAADDVARIADWVRGELARHVAGDLVPADPGPMAPHVHAADDHDHDHTHPHTHAHTH
ncbi:MAG: urease accessory protein UreG, partial [Solirubrobacteraceae bacterium]|nr:urease accessory protein UreG [Solirubrobacteraceae bacterium]